MNNKSQSPHIAMSGCLLGIPCRYDGHGKFNKKALKLFAQNKVLIVCPEIFGGLATPRPACEIVGGDGFDILDGKAIVCDKDGNDFTNEFIEGAHKALKSIKELGIEKVYLKSKSPSCGTSRVHNGTFSGELKKGSGVFSALLQREGIEIEEI